MNQENRPMIGRILADNLPSARRLSSQGLSSPYRHLIVTSPASPHPTREVGHVDRNRTGWGWIVLRWRDPERNVVTPDSQRTGFVHSTTRYTIRIVSRTDKNSLHFRRYRLRKVSHADMCSVGATRRAADIIGMDFAISLFRRPTHPRQPLMGESGWDLTRTENGARHERGCQAPRVHHALLRLRPGPLPRGRDESGIELHRGEGTELWNPRAPEKPYPGGQSALDDLTLGLLQGVLTAKSDRTKAFDSHGRHTA